MDKQQRALVFVSECGSITNGADYEPEDVALCNCLPFIKQQADSITIKNPGGGGKPRRTNDWRLAYMHTLTRCSIHMCECNVIQTQLNRKKVFHSVQHKLLLLYSFNSSSVCDYTDTSAKHVDGAVLSTFDIRLYTSSFQV